MLNYFFKPFIFLISYLIVAALFKNDPAKQYIVPFAPISLRSYCLYSCRGYGDFQQQIQLSKLFLKYSVYLMFGFLFLLILFKCKRKKQKQPSVNNK